MKARVKATGEIIEVEQVAKSIYGRTDGIVELYKKDMLDFSQNRHHSNINNLKATEDERIAYEAGYQNCCYNHGIPFVRIRRVWKSQVKWEVMLSDVAMERFPIEQIAQDIAREMKDEYEKYKRESNYDQAQP